MTVLTDEEIRTATKNVVYVAREGGAIKRLWRVMPKEPCDAMYEDHPDVVAFSAPKPADPSNFDNIAKRDKAVLLATAAMAGKTTAQAKAAFKAAWDSLP